MTPRGKELLERLRSEVVLGDGAMGTMLYARGIPIGTCYDELNLSHRELVKSIHRQYVVAGAEVIETNTFGANPVWLRKFGLDAKAREINFQGARLAREVAGDRVCVAGSIGPLGLKTGEEVPRDAEDGYKLQAVALAEGGADLLILETFLDLEELALALGAVKAAAPDTPVVASLAMFEKGRSARGVAIGDACRRARELGADVFGTNCGKGPRQLLEALDRLVLSGALTEPSAGGRTAPLGIGSAATAPPTSIDGRRDAAPGAAGPFDSAQDGPDTLLAAYPNAGYPEYVNGRYMYVTSPDYMADAARRLASRGATLIGGCCGTTPADIAAMKIALRGRKRATAAEARARVEQESPGLRPELLAPAKRRRRKAAAPAEREGVPPAPPPGEAAFVSKARARMNAVAGASPAGTGADARIPILVEVDAPKDLDVRKGLGGARKLLQAGTDAITVGDNPLAIMRMSNLAFGDLLQRETGRGIIAHLSCRDRNLIGTQSELMGMFALGIHCVLGITGDPASIGNQPGATSVYDLNSFGLVELMARMNRGENLVGEPLAARTSFTIGVAFNPNGRRIDDQLRRLGRKAELGAHFVQTQPCFDVARVREMYERAAPLGLPIFLGILPLTSLRAAEYLHNEVPGIEVPEEVRARFRGLDKDAAREAGQRIAREVIEATFEFAHGYYIIPPFNHARNALDLVAFIRERAAATSKR